MMNSQDEGRAVGVGVSYSGRERGARGEGPDVVESIVDCPPRRNLPDERESITHKFSIGGHEGYITVGMMYEDGCPGEIFITMAKEGSTISGLMDSLAVTISVALQYGAPLGFLVDKFAHVRFEPSGWTGNRQIPYAKSILDYIFRWLGVKFLGRNTAQRIEGNTGDNLLPKGTPDRTCCLVPLLRMRHFARSAGQSCRETEAATSAVIPAVRSGCSCSRHIRSDRDEM